MEPHVVQPFFDKDTWTFSYVVHGINDNHCVIIDSVLNYDQSAGRIYTESADNIVEFVKSHDLIVDYILETHAHADHVSAGTYLKSILGGQLAVSEHILSVQQVFKTIFNLSDEFDNTHYYFDRLLKDGEKISFGQLSFEVIATPGHTPACVTYRIGNSLFIGDTLFMPDVGTARCDFPGGDARLLYHSVHTILSYPDDTVLYLCHDYPPNTRHELHYQTTVKDQKEHNIHIHQGISEEEFVNLRKSRDKTLSLPQLMIPAIQINIRAGKYPPPETNGISYLKIPINHLKQ